MVNKTISFVNPNSLREIDKIITPIAVGPAESAQDIGESILRLRAEMAGPGKMFSHSAFLLVIQFDSDDPIEPNADLYRNDPASEEAMEKARKEGFQIPRKTGLEDYE